MYEMKRGIYFIVDLEKVNSIDQYVLIDPLDFYSYKTTITTIDCEQIYHKDKQTNRYIRWKRE